MAIIPDLVSIVISNLFTILRILIGLVCLLRLAQPTNSLNHPVPHLPPPPLPLQHLPTSTLLLPRSAPLGRQSSPQRLLHHPRNHLLQTRAHPCSLRSYCTRRPRRNQLHLRRSMARNLQRQSESKERSVSGRLTE
jgi:hypothetical protein